MEGFLFFPHHAPTDLDLEEKFCESSARHSVRVVCQFKLAEKVCGAQERWLLCEGSAERTSSQHMLLSSVSFLHGSALTKFSQKQVTEHIIRRRICDGISWTVTSQAQMRHYPLQTRPTETGQNMCISVPPRPKFLERNECNRKFQRRG